MAERPILFSAPMVRAILAGRKSQTRRVLKPQPDADWNPLPKICELHRMENGEPVEPSRKRDFLGMGWVNEDGLEGYRSPCAPGDVLWVKEAWRTVRAFDKFPPRELTPGLVVQHEATGPTFEEGLSGKLRPSIFMPRWASRISLHVTDVRVQRVQEISIGDSIAEGSECDTCIAMRHSACNRRGCFASVAAYRALWNHLNAERGFGWETNPWVVALTFERINKEPDHA